MKNLFFILSFILFSSSIFGQLDPRDITPAQLRMTNILLAGKEHQYLGLLNWQKSQTFDKSFHPYILEGNLSPYFFLLKGKDLHPPFYQKFSIVFNPILTLRMFNDSDNSFPVPPVNFKPGFKFNYFFNKLSEEKKFRLLTLDFYHFSNGQSGDFYTNDSKDINLINGNFSTNYLKASYTYSFFNNYNPEIKSGFSNNQLFLFKAAYQRDLSVGKALSYEKNLDLEGYGRNEFSFEFRFQSGNIPISRAWIPYRREKSYCFLERVRICLEPNAAHAINDINYKDTLLNNDSICLSPLIDILGEVPKRTIRPVQYWNIEFGNKTQIRFDEYEVQNRFSNETSVLFRNSNWRTLGFFAKFHYGRDYLNIRFQDNLKYFQVGLTFDINQYQVPGTKYIQELSKGDIVDERDLSLDNEKQAEIKSWFNPTPKLQYFYSNTTIPYDRDNHLKNPNSVKKIIKFDRNGKLISARPTKELKNLLESHQVIFEE